MGLLRRGILMASQSPWMREHAPHYGFMRRTVPRFMPGEEVQDALGAARTLASSGVQSVLTHLGENITDREEAGQVTQHYIDVTNRIQTARLPSATRSIRPPRSPRAASAEARAVVTVASATPKSPMGR